MSDVNTAVVAKQSLDRPIDSESRLDDGDARLNGVNIESAAVRMKAEDMRIGPVDAGLGDDQVFGIIKAKGAGSAEANDVWLENKARGVFDDPPIDRPLPRAEASSGMARIPRPAIRRRSSRATISPTRRGPLRADSSPHLYPDAPPLSWGGGLGTN